MKKTVLGLMAFGMIALGFMGCKKPALTHDDVLGSATVEGYILANLNERNDTLPDGAYHEWKEGIPTNVKLTFVIDSEDLERHPKAGFTYDKIQTTANVDANGYYKVTLPTPASTKSINVDLLIDEFYYQVVIDNYDGTTDSLKEREEFARPAGLNFNIYNGASIIYDYEY